MPSRLALSLLLTLAVITAPAAPIEITKIVSSHSACCPVKHVTADPCRCCPISANPTSSSAGSSCCSVQAPCFVGYANNSDEFVAGMSRGTFASFTDDRVNARFQRPSVPPPRSEFLS